LGVHTNKRDAVFPRAEAVKNASGCVVAWRLGFVEQLLVFPHELMGNRGFHRVGHRSIRQRHALKLFTMKEREGVPALGLGACVALVTRCAAFGPDIWGGVGVDFEGSREVGSLRECTGRISRSADTQEGTAAEPVGFGVKRSRLKGIESFQGLGVPARTKQGARDELGE
jgi:hypothetical protein